MKIKSGQGEWSEETKQVEGWFQCILWQDLNSRLGEWQWDLVRLDPHSKATELSSNRFECITSFSLTPSDSWEVNLTPRSQSRSWSRCQSIVLHSFMYFTAWNLSYCNKICITITKEIVDDFTTASAVNFIRGRSALIISCICQSSKTHFWIWASNYDFRWFLFHF